MHLFNKENIWWNPCSSLHTSSHPDKYNNSVNRIISKEEEREDPRRDTSIFEYSVSTYKPAFYKNFSVFTCNPVILCKENYSTYRINSTTRILQEILQLQGSSHADRYKASSNKYSLCIQSFYRAESNSKAPTVHTGFQ